MFYRNIFSNDIYYPDKHPIYSLAEWYQILANFSPSSLIFQTEVYIKSVELAECRGIFGKMADPSSGPGKA